VIFIARYYTPKGESVSGRILAIAAIAFIAYVLIPGLAGTIVRFRLRRLTARLASGAGSAAALEGVDLHAVTLSLGGEGERLSLDSRETRFLAFDREAGPVRLSWKSVRLVQAGTALAYIPGPNRFKRPVCVFHEEGDLERVREASKGLIASRSWKPEAGSGPVTAFSVAAGVFLEFLALIEASGKSGMELAAIAALVGVFGKALPYLPPGILLTIAGAKKNRRRGAVGFLMIALGTALNTAILFFAILKVGFGLP
jgi:hypothetical protein